MKFFNFYNYKRQWKFIIFFMAIAIGALSLVYTNILVKKLKTEERVKIEMWAEATRSIAIVDDITNDISFYLKVITNNKTIPVILTDKNDSIISHINLPDINEPGFYQKNLKKMKTEKEPIIIDLPEGNQNRIYYTDSTILKQLSAFPYIQLAIITVFIFISYFAFSRARSDEQNRVWVGMSKETAHQLGTPISSLMAWINILGQTETNTPYIAEMEKDIFRLQTITERFSKIGSQPSLHVESLVNVIENAINYMKTRTSKNINFITNYEVKSEVLLPLNRSLFNWVIENLVKNSVDAMDGKGTIKIKITETDKEAHIEIADTGKGIPKSKHKAIFNPGYTSKDRGWGLGLSLTKRIIKNYHNGKIFVAASDQNQGTTFKIILPK